MKDLIFKQVTKLDEENLNTLTTWMFNWWGKEDGLTFDAVKCYIEHSFNKTSLPQTYALFKDGKIVGSFQLTLSDLTIRPDIYPWFANFYVDEKYRGNGFARKMLENLKTKAEKLPFKEIYLYTEHVGLYEKFGWKFVSDFDTFCKTPRMQRLYKLKLN